MVEGNERYSTPEKKKAHGSGGGAISNVLDDGIGAVVPLLRNGEFARLAWCRHV